MDAVVRCVGIAHRWVHVRQEVGGIPVLGSNTTLSLGANGDRLLLDHTWASLGSPRPATLSRTGALRRATLVVGAPTLRVMGLVAQPTLVVVRAWMLAGG